MPMIIISHIIVSEGIGVARKNVIKIYKKFGFSVLSCSSIRACTPQAVREVRTLEFCNEALV